MSKHVQFTEKQFELSLLPIARKIEVACKETNKGFKLELAGQKIKLCADCNKIFQNIMIERTLTFTS